MTAPSLDKATSPYLQMHKGNPVAWRPWSADVIAEAKASGKPIFLNIGYLGCRWCHAMNAESFSDAETAAYLNAHYIPVIVDRDERPDVDQIYQSMAGLLGHNGGWPLNAFLTDEGKPFLVAGFLSKDEQGNQPPFLKVLTDMAAVYKEKPEEARGNANAVFQQIDALFGRDTRAPLEAIQLNMAAMRVGQRYDIFLGGITGPMKFPGVTSLEVLWRAYLRSGAPQFLQLVSVTLDHILGGGLYDHIGGGFFRNTVDEGWLAPHFEKMLPDNALLVSFLTGMWQFNRNELSRQRVAETIDWMLRELRLEGAFAAGLDGLSEGEDGKFYLWTEAEIDAALTGTYATRFKQVYGVRSGGQPGALADGRTLPRRLGNAPNPPLTEADEALLAKQRGLLREAQAKRVRPSRDDKLLADWNGLAIKALAFAGCAFNRPDWLEAAITCFDSVTRLMGEGDVLYHSWAGGRRGARGFADDYANMAAAALQLFEATGEARYVEAAKAWTRTLNTQFWDTTRDGYYYTGLDAEKLIIRPRMVFDQPQPSANGTMVAVLTQLALITGEKDYGARAQDLLVGFAGDLGRGLMSCGSFMNGFEIFATGLQIVVVGPRANPRTQELIRTIWGKALPNRLLLVVESGKALPANHPAYGKDMENGQPTVYICMRHTCSPAITNAVTLNQALTLPVPRTAAGNA